MSTESIKTLFFNADAGGVLPNAPQDAGVQGDHNAVEVVFILDPTLQRDGQVYRLIYEDGAGCVHATGLLTRVDNEIRYRLPLAWTRHGGIGVLQLVVSVCGENGDEQTVFSGAARLRFQASAVSVADPEETRPLLSSLLHEVNALGDAVDTLGDTVVEQGKVLESKADQSDLDALKTTVTAQGETLDGKADKDTDATAGNVAVFDEAGNPVDGGVTADTLATKAYVDTAVAHGVTADHLERVMTYRGSVSSVSLLPTPDTARVGDVLTVTGDGTKYVWTDTAAVPYDNPDVGYLTAQTMRFQIKRLISEEADGIAAGDVATLTAAGMTFEGVTLCDIQRPLRTSRETVLHFAFPCIDGETANAYPTLEQLAASEDNVTFGDVILGPINPSDTWYCNWEPLGTAETGDADTGVSTVTFTTGETTEDVSVLSIPLDEAMWASLYAADYLQIDAKMLPPSDTSVTERGKVTVRFSSDNVVNLSVLFQDVAAAPRTIDTQHGYATLRGIPLEPPTAVHTNWEQLVQERLFLWDQKVGISNQKATLSSVVTGTVEVFYGNPCLQLISTTPIGAGSYLSITATKEGK